MKELYKRIILQKTTDQRYKVLTDHYHPVFLCLLVLIVGLNILDSLFTMTVLDLGGYEVNPIVRSVMELYGERFWVWKFCLVSASLTLLFLHIRFRFVKSIILGITVVYTAVVLYQISLIVCP